MTSPKLTITLTDDSIFVPAGGSTLPLFFIVTQQDKPIPNSTTIAERTKKEFANKFDIVTSQREVLEKYGSPIFQSVQGTVLQGNELNEYGLWSLWSYMSRSSAALVIRSDLDLAQLTPTNVEPSKSALNGTWWFDLASTEYGVFRANGNATPGFAWDKVAVKTPTENEVTVLDVPLATFGSNGNIAIVAIKQDGTPARDNILYEKIGGVWYSVGSDTWSDNIPTVVIGTVTNPTVTLGHQISINAVTVTFTGTNLAAVIADITAASIPNIVASNDTNRLKITNTDGADIVIANVLGTGLTNLGLTATTTPGVVVFYNAHSSVPSGLSAGSIWVKRTEPNFGAKYSVKQFSTNTNQWTERTAGLYAGAIEAEIAAGTSLVVGSLFVDYPIDGTTGQRIRTYSSTSALTITGTDLTPTTSIGDQITITVANAGVPTPYTVTFTGTTLTTAINDIDAVGIPNLDVEADISGAIKFVRPLGGAIRFADVIGTSLASLGILATEYSAWSDLDYIPSLIEPTSEADQGTYWLNDDLLVDVLVNDGDEWKGLVNYNAAQDPAGVQVTSLEPTLQSDGTALVNGDLWLDSADSENYPALYRWNSSTSAWEPIDKTDQTTPFGVIFFDARENAGPAYAGSIHDPFSTDEEELVISNYVDPDAPNPQTYPAGMIMFNTRFSTNNVKVWEPEFFTGLTGTFQVGNSSLFDNPGTINNPKISRWVTISGNKLDGSPYMGRKAQRVMVVRAMASSILNNEDIRSETLEYNLVSAPGYVEVMDELLSLVLDRKETAYIVTDTHPRLRPNGTDIQTWATNANNAPSNGEEGRITRYYLIGMGYPWGLGTNLDGNEVMIPWSAMKLNSYAFNDSVAYPWKSAAGSRRGVVLNATSVGYLTSENEFQSVILNEGLSDVLYNNNINPIRFFADAGLLHWGDKTLHNTSSALDRENVARLIVFMRTQLAKIARPYFFELNNKRTRDDFKGAIDGFLQDLITKEALFDFVTVCDESNNTPTRIDRNELWCDIAIAPQKSINYIFIPIRIVNTGEI